MHLLDSPIQDGGQWDMFVNLLMKYGTVPKKVMAESYHSSNSAQMNKLITRKLREFAKDLRTAISNGKSKSQVSKMKDEIRLARAATHSNWIICPKALVKPPPRKRVAISETVRT